MDDKPATSTMRQAPRGRLSLGVVVASFLKLLMTLAGTMATARDFMGWRTEDGSEHGVENGEITGTHDEPWDSDGFWGYLIFRHAHIGWFLGQNKWRYEWGWLNTYYASFWMNIHLLFTFFLWAEGRVLTHSCHTRQKSQLLRGLLGFVMRGWEPVTEMMLGIEGIDSPKTMRDFCGRDLRVESV